MRRGEVWWADLPPPSGRRPILLLTRNDSYAVRNQANAAEVTTRIRGIPVEVPLGPQDGLPRRCVANLDNINTVALAALTELVTLLSPPKMREVDAALQYALGLSG